MDNFNEKTVWRYSPSQILNIWTYLICGLVSLTLVGAIVAIPIAFWKYLVVKNMVFELTTERFLIHSGVLNKRTDEIELYRIRDSRLDQPFVFRFFGLSNITVVSSDVTNPELLIPAIPDGQQARNALRNAIEHCRQRKHVRVGEFD